MSSVRLMEVGFLHNNILLFSDRLAAVREAIQRSPSIKSAEETWKRYLLAASGKSNYDARQIAKDILGEEVFWDWDRKDYVDCLPASATHC